MSGQDNQQIPPSVLQKAMYLQKAMNDSFDNQVIDNETREQLKGYNEALNKLITVETINEGEILRLSKTFIETLEGQKISASLKRAFEEQGIHSILYHYSSIDTYYIYTSTGQGILKNASVGLACAAVSVAIFATVSFLGPIILLPIATALFAASVAYIAGLLYGVINDLLATRANLAYFVLGHQYNQRSFFISNDLNVQAIGWGVVATRKLAMIAAIVFGLATFIAAMASTAPIATFVLPLMLVTVPFIVLTVDLYTRYKVKGYMQDGVSISQIPAEIQQEIKRVYELPENATAIPLDKIDFSNPAQRLFLDRYGFLDSYQTRGLALMCTSKHEKANWIGNGMVRNLLGYIVAPLMAIGALSATLAISKAAVPVILFSTLLSTTGPVIGAAIVILALAIALTYAYVNQNKQIDNKYKLRVNYSSEPSTGCILMKVKMQLRVDWVSLECVWM